MKRIYLIIELICIILLTCGCGITSVNSIARIKAPTNKSLVINGTWKIVGQKVIDESISDDKRNFIGKYIKISSELVKIEESVYTNPTFKLKIVDESYVISYESSLTAKDFFSGIDSIKTITIVDKSNLVCEFLLANDRKAFVIYRGMLLEVERTSNETLDNTGDEININPGNKDIKTQYYDSDVGVMIALKSQRNKDYIGINEKERYRTLWISFKHNRLQPVLEENKIIFPRINGIWEIENKVFMNNGHRYEYFSSEPNEYNSSNNNNNININKSMNYSVNLDKDTYKDIVFVGNNYIAIERYDGKEFKNQFPKYQVIPIDNINSNKGISLDEMFSKDDVKKYTEDFNNTLISLPEKNRINLDNNIDLGNFSVNRKDGKWNLVGKISPNNNEGDGVDFKLRSKVTNALLNYDTLCIPWKVLRGEIPLIKDAYTAPTGRLAIAVFEKNLAVYEIQNMTIKGPPLTNIELKEGEQIIMAEWCSGSYVEEWEKAFKDKIESPD